MSPQQTLPESDSQAPPTVAAAVTQAAIQPSSPRFFFSSAAESSPSAGSHRRIAIAVDLSDESAYAVKWDV
uniref:Uncharacterized protein n=1 Tax=Musa acuminata subsp. malaccensis TaxID=214687 RepID=A0A804HQ12_MUSAM